MDDTTLQIRRSSATNTDADKNLKNCHKEKDVIFAYDTSKITEPPAPNSKCYFIHFTGLDYVSGIHYSGPWEDISDIDNPVMLKKSKYYFDWDLLSQDKRDILFDSYELTLDWNIFKDCLITKVTGEAVT